MKADMIPKKFILPILAIVSCAFVERGQASQEDFDAAYDFTVRYLPRYQTWLSQTVGQSNVLIAPKSPMGPEYKGVVAINDDTLYTSATTDLTAEPVVLTLPSYSYKYSIIQVNGYGTVLDTGLVPISTGGKFLLTGPNFKGTIPADFKNIIKVPENWTQLAIRTDKYYYNGTTYKDVQVDASNFRTKIKLQTLSNYRKNPSGGATEMEDLSYFGTPMKTAVDLLVQGEPKAFLTSLELAMISPTTSPISNDDKFLIANFSTRFAAAKKNANNGSINELSDMCAGARSAHNDIIANWRFHFIGNNWIHFNNMGDWGSNYLDRSSGNLYIQYCNNRQAAYYAQAFLDSNCNLLTGAGNKSYTITFAKDQTPEFERFWSITAYTPEDIELVKNPANKYVVASYTPGLKKNLNGSITITLRTLGKNETTVDPNVLPIPSGNFSIMLRVYGPKGSALAGTYVPPVVQAAK
jgi:hypothetical protein